MNVLSPDAPHRRRLIWLWPILYTLAMVAGGFAIRAFDLGWAGAAMLMLASALLLVPLFRAFARQALGTGNASTAMMRYNRRMLASSFAYMGGLFAAIYAYRQLGVSGAALWGVALLPSLGTVGMIWAMARLLLEEDDEYQRFRVVRAALVALGFLLLVSTIWGFFEQFALVPHVPSWAAMPLFALGLMLSSLFRSVRA